jgi:Cu-Zn family superoxide dismutase
MPNFTVAADGTAKATIIAPGITLGDDSHSVFTDAGTALVIHAMADDMKSDPAGNAGARIACGIIPKPDDAGIE